MKKTISVITALLICLSLCACDTVDKLKNIELPPLPTVTPAPAPSAVPDTPAPAAPAETPVTEERVIVSVRRNLKEAYDPQNGTQRILSFSWDTPTVCIDTDREAESKINEYIAMLDETYYTGMDYSEGPGTGYSNMLTLAEDNYRWFAENGTADSMTELVSDRTVSVLRNDNRVLTLRYIDYSDIGGVHGGYVLRAYNYEAATGELLTLDDLSSDPAGFRQYLEDFMLDRLCNDEMIFSQTEGFVPEDETELRAVLSLLLREGSWYLDNSGLVIFSDLYEISSYAAGPVYFSLPYSELKAYLREELLPDEVRSSGSIRVLSERDMPQGSVEIIDMVKAGEGGGTFFIAAEGEVKFVSVTSVEYADYASAFFDRALIWNCSSMNGCALQLSADIPDGMPNLKISFVSDAGEQSFLLSESGEDGSVLLIPEAEIVAVG